MGLDMYLIKKTYIGAHFKHRNVSGKVELYENGKPIEIDVSKIDQITEQVGYWRKANAIHKWFVDKTQDGQDDCKESDVSFDQLMELLLTCSKVLKSKDATLLPPQEGFFFGSTKADEYYFEQIKHTIEMLEKIDPSGDYYYQASW